MVENGFDGDQLALAITRLPRGKARIEAYQEAVRLADAAQDAYWQLGFRFEYASELYFQDDPPKCIPVAAEFGPIFENAPTEIRTNDATVQAYLMITQMGVDVMQDLPQIPMPQYEEALEHYHKLTKRFGMGWRTYLWQMYNRWEYADSNRALEYMERVWQTPIDDSYGDCMACEYSKSVVSYVRLGRLEDARRYATPLETFRIHPCESSFQRMWAAYLNAALDNGDLETAAPLAEKLYKKGNRNRTDLCFLGPVLRCWGMTNSDRAVSLFSRRLEWALGMWDQKLVYDFLKGAWVCFRTLAQKRERVKMSLPNQFPLWREDGRYSTGELSDWAYRQASEIARKFDRRNNSHWMTEDLGRA